MLRNSASGPEIGLLGRILAGLLLGKQRHRPSGRPKAGWRADFGSFLIAVRPKSGPEVRFPARKHYCVVLSTSTKAPGPFWYAPRPGVPRLRGILCARLPLGRVGPGIGILGPGETSTVESFLSPRCA